MLAALRARATYAAPRRRRPTGGQSVRLRPMKHRSWLEQSDNSSGHSSGFYRTNRPDRSGRALKRSSGQNVRVSWDGAASFNKALCLRVRAFRDAKGWTQERMATALGVPAERYRKYEGRSAMPPYLLTRFATIVEQEISVVLTGKPESGRHPRPPVAPPPAASEPPPPVAKRGRR